MAIYAFNNFGNNDAGYGILFVILTLFFLGIGIYSIVRNRKLARKEH
ncbi:hypothetical protein KFZ58_06370 [Virgibacillus sp. NKC19-16]|nr:hypothetical protein [Virgibacillus sp. NKC19-16]UJL47493.1 hypothetical protein KFZ58_06370 [Virgibacillus sp. NKC19-16]